MPKNRDCNLNSIKLPDEMFMIAVFDFLNELFGCHFPVSNFVTSYISNFLSCLENAILSFRLKCAILSCCKICLYKSYCERFFFLFVSVVRVSLWLYKGL